jgi:beta-galactosidase
MSTCATGVALPPLCLRASTTSSLLDFSGSPAVDWAGLEVTRVWRRGNRGNVASALIEKPACGDFLPILDGGYALQYTSLIEHRAAKGMVLFCQTDVSGRTESDPAAETLARNIVQYARHGSPSHANGGLRRR